MNSLANELNWERNLGSRYLGRGRLLRTLEGAAGGAVAGAAVGAIGGPAGAAVGAFIGSVAGAVAESVLEREGRKARSHDRELDETIGVTCGDLGARSPADRPTLRSGPLRRGE